MKPLVVGDVVVRATRENWPVWKRDCKERGLSPHDFYTVTSTRPWTNGQAVTLAGFGAHLFRGNTFRKVEDLDKNPSLDSLL